ncbi:MAG: alpha/beta fold hydrolase [Gammaproteobacteria bacterium]
MDEEFDLRLAAGRVHVRRVGAPDAPLVLLLHGLSAHLHGFDYLVERLAAPDRQLVALDLRGRGRSEITRKGSYGLAAHACDALEVATSLGADRFDLVGWSMGALIGIEIANGARARLRRIALIDLAGRAGPAAVDAVKGGLDRLAIVVKQREDYIKLVRGKGVISPWNDFWDRFYCYELGPYGDRFKPTTSKSACLEDLADLQGRDWHALWPGITMPALLVRCLTSIRTPIGDVLFVPEAERDGLRRAAPQVKLAEVRANHYTVMQDARAASAIREFLDQHVGDAGGRGD